LKIIFVHIPKTGGSSVEKTLGRRLEKGWRKKEESLMGWDRINKIWKQHLTCREMLVMGYIDPSVFNSYFKFTFVRNPWERLVSEYMWKRHKRFDTFKTFIEALGTWAPAKAWSTRRGRCEAFQHLRPQTDFVSVGNESPVDFIGRFENLQGDFNVICDRIGIEKLELRHDKKMEHGAYWEYYDESTQEIVARMYADEIDYFEYVFGH
jgi:hypothetical protein